MIVAALTYAVAFMREYLLYSVEQGVGHERLVLAWIVGTVPAHDTDIERICKRQRA